MRPMQTSRVSPTPETILTVAASSGSSVIRCRIATIGSSTDPWLSEFHGTGDRLRIGDGVSRPMNRMRSVS